MKIYFKIFDRHCKIQIAFQKKSILNQFILPEKVHPCFHYHQILSFLKSVTDLTAKNVQGCISLLV